ncbi:hypothetical protein ACFFJT_15305 [Dyella flava]|uniref:Secreted protein n=1 Tax=Dyella flava TaxID=1920170 RepID=A0ABS2K317_9GAMM|nr:hypothetical protein [Dyella flava]MBM7125529.1 hypothetical protein [Dyella flava]GLQ51609.1 hypothetical protein GCM10010872_30580 [Dyella flava]
MFRAYNLIAASIATLACGTALALSRGSVRINTREVAGVLYACLPEGTKDVSVWSADVTEFVSGATAPVAKPPTPFTRWIIRLKSGAKPLVLSQGQCLAFGQHIDGYEQGDTIYPLEAGKTYNFSLRAVDPPNDFLGGQDYVGVFCVRRNDDHSLSYLPFIYQTDGSVTYPQCSKANR